MKRILAAVNEDGMKVRVVGAAGKLAGALKADLTICSVMPEEDYQDLQFHRSEAPDSAPFGITEAEEHARALADRAAKGLKGFGAAATTVGLVGEPAAEIVSLAREIKADLIVMGFEELQGLERLRALGSVSRAVMEHAPCAVMVVPIPRDVEVSSDGEVTYAAA